jgi:DNA-3-methyladenine glycosylase
VLIRALQPLEGLELMATRRAPDGRGIDEHDLCRGPGNLTKALGITIKDNRLDLTTSKLTIEDRGMSVGEIATGPRIGIRVAVERPWRYWVEGHRSVSGHRKRSHRMKEFHG